MDKMAVYIWIWVLMLVAVLGQDLAFTSAPASTITDVSILLLAVVEAFLSGAFFMNLRNEPKMLTSFLLMALLVLTSLLITAILSVGM